MAGTTRFSACLLLSLALSAPSLLLAQHTMIGGPLSGPMPFLNAPFSAEAVTTVRQKPRSGTPLEQSTTARYYRDSFGRVRIELLMEGLPPPKTAAERHMRLTIYPMTEVHPPAPWWAGYTVDPVTRTVRYTGRSLVPLSSGGGHSLGIPVGGGGHEHYFRAQDFLGHHAPHFQFADNVERVSLGTKRIAGMETTGYRTTATIPALVIRNPAPTRTGG